MATFTEYEHGTPSWVDLMSPDVDASQAFYTALFGWDAEDQHDEDGNRIYVMFRKGGKAVAGLGGQMPGTEQMPPFWNSHISVEDVDAVAEKVQQAGGQVVAPPMQVMEAGRMAVFADPTGAMFSAWQPGLHIGAELVNEPGSYSWNELLDRDVEQAKAFYAQVFDWQWQAMDMPNGPYHVVQGGQNGGLAGAMAMPDDMPEQVPNHWVVYFAVADADATVAAAKDLGGQVVWGPQDVPGVGRLATLHDGQGGSFAIMQHPEQD